MKRSYQKHGAGFSISQTDKGSYCQALRCHNRRANKGGEFCPKHRDRMWKYNDPAAYTYSKMKANARRRGVRFSMTLDEFRKWAKRTGYLKGKGRTAGSMTVDRIDPRKGYTIKNIQVLSLSENSSKSDDVPF